VARPKKTLRTLTTSSPRVLAYSRVSTDEQGKSGLGLNAQVEAIRTEAQRRGWTDLRYLSDDGHSAKSLDRPAIQEALGILAAGEADILVVSKLDRLSRSLLDFASLMERSQREGWALVALDLGVDTSTAAGEMMAHVMASFAQFERRLISERTSAALEAAKRRGQRLGRPILTPEPVRRRIAREKARGRTLQAIADRLNADQVATASGKPWGTSSVQKILLSVGRDHAHGETARR
jgi:DNA invertase Pin-like site-specific DNA recombinase